ncbi:PCMD domain-containing protein [Dysgonomonas sp. 520]|uniref:PCMD domain-containing protein n=1 Tax=Dysgonomonas sp. 520 TaxID=2302931 RepID=UPI0013D556DD|nr:PCMD domain-containing protein [Dysgonomonas sp. 520]NDW09732.1 hypothetical protein [Dysgonomonas sp. 520]
MKTNSILLFFLSFIALSSCIKEEGLNLEADITSFKFMEIEAEPYLNQETGTIKLEISDSDLDITNLTPVITVFEGATIQPESGVAQDFSKAVEYTVTSENKQWQRTYKVSITNVVLKYSFEDWYINEIGSGNKIFKYPTPTDDFWSSANSGIAIAKVGAVDEYPTHPTTDAYKGKYAAELKTQRGGVYWKNLIPIFSGSLFRGKFSLNMADFVKSAKFGQFHTQDKGRPVEFRGYYKYKPGDVFYNEDDQIVPGKIDEFSIYAVLYEVTKGNGADEFLDGTNILSSSKTVAIAELTDRSAKENYTYFSLPFVYNREPDYNKFDYKLAIVCASSREGDYYRGAVGSTLIVDELEIITKFAPF